MSSCWPSWGDKKRDKRLKATLLKCVTINSTLSNRPSGDHASRQARPPVSAELPCTRHQTSNSLPLLAIDAISAVDASSDRSLPLTSACPTPSPGVSAPLPSLFEKSSRLGSAGDSSHCGAWGQSSIYGLHRAPSRSASAPSDTVSEPCALHPAHDSGSQLDPGASGARPSSASIASALRPFHSHSCSAVPSQSHSRPCTTLTADTSMAALHSEPIRRSPEHKRQHLLIPASHTQSTLVDPERGPLRHSPHSADWALSHASTPAAAQSLATSTLAAITAAAASRPAAAASMRPAAASRPPGTRKRPDGCDLVISEPETADSWQDTVLLSMLFDSSLVLGPGSEEEPRPDMVLTSDHIDMGEGFAGAGSCMTLDSLKDTHDVVEAGFSMGESCCPHGTAGRAGPATGHTAACTACSRSTTPPSTAAAPQLRVVSIAGTPHMLVNDAAAPSTSDPRTLGSPLPVPGSGVRPTAGTDGADLGALPCLNISDVQLAVGAAQSSTPPPPPSYRRKDRSLLRPLRCMSNPDLGSIAEEEQEDVEESSSQVPAPLQQASNSTRY